MLRILRTRFIMISLIMSLGLTSLIAGPVSSLEVCGNCATAELDVTDFTQKTVTWSLSFSLQGDWQGKTILADTDNLHLYGDNLFYDRTTNTTTFTDQEADNWNKASPVGIFPNETWFVNLYFATNNTVFVQNFNQRPHILQVDSSNYSGNFSAGTIQCDPPSNVTLLQDCYRQYDGGGLVKDPFQYYWPRDYYLQLRYNVTLFVWRNPGAVTQLSGASTVLTWLWLLTTTLAIFPLSQLGVLLFATWRSLARKGKVRDYKFLDGTFFTIGVGLLFFLPVYNLSLSPVVSPVTNSPIQDRINNLIIYDSVIVFFGLALVFVKRLFPPGAKSSSEKSRNWQLSE